MKNTRKLVLAAMLLALGVILPQAFHAIPNAGSIFLPMHIPVLICGMVTGPFYGTVVGFLTPFLSHLIFGMPPAAVLPSMLCELTVYGLATGLLTQIIRIRPLVAKVYAVLISSMLLGRITYGILNALIFRAGTYSLAAWLSAAFTTALPGIIIQLVLIPALVVALAKAKLIEIQ